MMGASVWQRIAARWRVLPGRSRLGVVMAVFALAGLGWQHYNSPATPTASVAVSTPATDPVAAPGHDDGDDEGGHAHGEYQPSDHEPSTVSTVAPQPPVDVSAAAARTVAERFATNFADPAGGREAWLGRLTGDVTPELLGQYQLTDIRNVTQAAVTDLGGPVAGRVAGDMAFEAGFSDASRISISLDMTDAGWKVSRAIPIPAPAPAPGDGPAVGQAR